MPLNPNFRQQYISFKRLRKKILAVGGFVVFFLSLLAFMLMIYDLGFKYDARTEAFIHHLNSYLLVVFFVAMLNRFLAIVIWKAKDSKSRFIETLILLFFVVALSLRFFMRGDPYDDIGWIRFFNGSVFTYLVFLYVFVLEISRRSFKLFHSRFSPAVLFIYSFLFMIFAGAGLLLLPRATHAGISITDALFTATSAVCVTGLIVVDTATYFTPFGRTIIILLVQLGGLGIMTFTSFFALLMQQSFSFQNQLFMQDLVNEDKLGQTFRTIFKIVAITLGLEAIGAVLIYFSLEPEVVAGIGTTRLKFAVFHAISAYCNAGFVNLTDGFYDPRFRFNYNIQLVLAVLIILGGLGFPVIFNLMKYFKNKLALLLHFISRREAYMYKPRLVHLNTKIVLATTFLLLLAGMVLIFLAERK